MPIPEFRADGWLPEGHHPATWEEIAGVFGGERGSRRAAVFANLLSWRDALRDKGISGRLILDGSFISQKAEPGDFDGYFVYNISGKQPAVQDTEMMALLDNASCKRDFGGDVFAFSETSVRDFPQFCRTDGFDFDKLTRQPKGVLEIEI